MLARIDAIPPAWHLSDALHRHPALALLPTESSDVVIAGELRCCRVGPGDVLVDETYAVTIDVPRSFPRALPRVVETEGRVPAEFHVNPDGSLCLGSPIAQRLAIEDAPTVGAFIDRVLIPFLYGHAFYTRFRVMPFGELPHGAPGIEHDVRRLFHLPSGTDAEAFLWLASLKRRHANKKPCPCHSGRRVGRCHGAAVHQARRRLGRFACGEERIRLAGQRRHERPRAGKEVDSRWH